MTDIEKNEPNTPEQNAGQPAEQPGPQQGSWQKPSPQLTLEPDPAVPPIQFPEPPKAPEPPKPQDPAAQTQQGSQPVQYATYNYNFNTQPDPGYQANQQQGYDPNYQPPNFTAQSYQPQPAQQPKYTTPPPGYRQKSRMAAALLAFLVGTLGIHNYYLGNNTKGTIQLVVALAGGLLTCGLATIGVAIWALIDAVNLLSDNNPKFDGNGVILRD